MLRSAISAQSSDSSAARAVALLALVEALRSAGDTEAAARSIGSSISSLGSRLGPPGRMRTCAQPSRTRPAGWREESLPLQSWQPLSMSRHTPRRPPRPPGAQPPRSRQRRRGAMGRPHGSTPSAPRRTVWNWSGWRRQDPKRPVGESEQAAAERAAVERAAEERAQVERDERAEAARQAAAEEAERLERKRRRAERLEAHRLGVERREAEHREAERLEAARQAGAMSGAGSADAERDELERIQAELTSWSVPRNRPAPKPLRPNAPQQKPHRPS